MTEALGPWQTLASDPEGRARWIRYVEKWEEKIHSFLSFDGAALKGFDSVKPLSNVPFAVKDNIAVKDFPFTIGSKITGSLCARYSATCVDRLIEAGGWMVGKTNLDEFGMGSSCDNSAFFQTSNPFDSSFVAGGSGGGSAAAAAAGLVPFALGSDTGGSVRQPASFCGVYGLRPTYGAVSRFGLAAYASSLDVIGITARDLSVLFDVFEIIKGADPKDQTAGIPTAVEEEPPAKKIGVLSDPVDMDSKVACAYKTTVSLFRDAGFVVEKVQLPLIEYAVPVYYTIATAEASANLARYTGIRYGLSTPAETIEEMVVQTREKGFGEEVRLRILLGTYVLKAGFKEQYYLRARKIQEAIRYDLDRLFERVDLLLWPTYPTLPFRHGASGLSPMQQKLADKLTVVQSLAGVPAISFPVALFEGLPIGMQLTARRWKEARLMQALLRMQGAFVVPRPDGFEDEPWRG